MEGGGQIKKYGIIPLDIAVVEQEASCGEVPNISATTHVLISVTSVTNFLSF